MHLILRDMLGETAWHAILQLPYQCHRRLGLSSCASRGKAIFGLSLRMFARCTNVHLSSLHSSRVTSDGQRCDRDPPGRQSRASFLIEPNAVTCLIVGDASRWYQVRHHHYCTVSGRVRNCSLSGQERSHGHSNMHFENGEHGKLHGRAAIAYIQRDDELDGGDFTSRLTAKDLWHKECSVAK